MTPPYQPTYGDVGLARPSDSQELMWNAHDGSRLSKGDGWRVIQYLRLVVEPEVIAACAEAPGCAKLMPRMQTAALTTTSKFLIDYVMRPLSSGQTYAVHGNYHWDLTHNLFLKPMRTALLHTPGGLAWLEARPAFGDLLGVSDYRPALRQEHPDTAHLNDGDVDPTPRVPDAPLSDATCDALDAAALAHRQHGQALLAGANANSLALLGAEVRRTQAAAEATARTPREQMLLGLFFTGGRHPRHTKAYVDACTQATMAHHDAWHEALGCEARQPPDLLRVVHAALAHGRAHWLRATPMGARLRELCSAALEPQHGTRCPITNVP